jgi:predicted transcriptional regulator
LENSLKIKLQNQKSKTSNISFLKHTQLENLIYSKNYSFFMKTGYKVYDCMTTKPISVSSEASLEECAKVMAKNHVGALVIKDNHESKGLITEQDIVRNVIATGINPLTKKENDFMFCLF